MGTALGRLVGFFRFQLLIFLLGLSTVSDNIIYYYTLVWFLYNFFISPLLSGVVIPELEESNDYNFIICKHLKELIFYSVILFSGLLVIFLIPQLELFELGMIINLFIILLLMGFNELISLYNQFKNKYFTYSINPLIWNLFSLVYTVILYYLGIISANTYLLCYSVSVLVTLIFQFYTSDLKLKIIKDKFKTVRYQFHFKYYHIASVIFTSAIFIDFNFLKISAEEGSISFYSVLNKLPELFASFIAGTIIVVLFNNLVKNKIILEKAINIVIVLTLASFSLLYLIISHDSGQIINYLFNTELRFSASILLAITSYFAIFTICSFLVRASYFLKIDKSITLLLLLILGIKFYYYTQGAISIVEMINFNLVSYSILLLFSIYKIIKNNVWHLSYKR
ncbi:MATE family efflux transporter [Gracilimonas amylolytica]|uniref:hypothetical protein n=1 Tax=Gracilimonas amylolytica TaxID=1749045 RepID=UPI000CD87B2B|nr:hypothetical protein [Gracilimonas amylolytica]